MNIRNQVFLIKVEPDRGTDAAPDKTNDALDCGEVSIRLDKQVIDRVAVRRSISALKREIGQKRLMFTFSVELKGAGTVDVPPDVGPALIACGMKETINAGVSVVYQPEADPSDMQSVTCKLYVDGIMWAAVGCVGNVTQENPPGGLAVLNFELEGLFSDIADTALPTAPVFQATGPLRAIDAGLAFGAFANAVVRNFRLVTGNKIIRPPNMNADDGIDPPEITFRDPTASTEIDAVLEATSPFYGDLEDRDTRAITYTLGSVAGNIVQVDIPAAAVDDVQKGNVDDKMTWRLELQCCESADGAADNYRFTFK